MREAGQLCTASCSPPTPTAVGLSALWDLSRWPSQWGWRSGSSPSQLTAEHVVLKTRSESQPDCFLSVPAAQKSGAAFRQKGGGRRVSCLQLKTILML